MKTLLMSLALTFMCCALFAQVPTDTTNNNNNLNTDSSQMNQVPPPTDTTNNNWSDTSGNNNMNNMQNIPDTLNNGMNNNANNPSNMDNGMVNNNRSSDTSLLVNPMNTPGQPDYAALPVLETFVPDAVVSTVKQKFGNELVYDITAVKAEVDSSSSMTNSNSINPSNQSASVQDSTTVTVNAGNPSASVQNSTSISTDNQPTTNQAMNNNQQSASLQTSNMPQEEHYNYIVRILKNGTVTSEMISADGSDLGNGVQ